MRKVAVFSLAFGLAVSMASAATPQLLTYQGSLVDSGGNAVADGPYNIRFQIFANSTGGSALYTEADAGVVVTNGVFSTILGNSGTPILPVLTSGDTRIYLEVAVDLNGNATYEPEEIYSPRVLLSGAPWALDSDLLDGHPPADFALAAHGHAWGDLTGVPATFPPDAHDHDARYYTETELSTSGGGGQVHWDNIVGAPAGGGDITAVIAGAGLTGGAMAGDATLDIDTSGVVNAMLADRAADERAVDLAMAGSGNATDWSTITRHYMTAGDSITSFTHGQVLFVMNGETEGGSGQVRVVVNGDGVATQTVSGGGGRPWVYLTPPFLLPTAAPRSLDLEYMASSAANPMIWRRVALLYRSGEIPGPLAIEAAGTGERLNLRTGDLYGVDDINFATTANPWIYDVNGITFGSDPTYYLNIGPFEMVNLNDNDGDFVQRFTTGRAYITAGPAGASELGAGVHLPNGATVTALRAWVRDNDAAGNMSVTLSRWANGSGTQEAMASVVWNNAFVNTNVVNATDTTITDPIISNSGYYYMVRVAMNPSVTGSSLAFYNVRITFTMPGVRW